MFLLTIATALTIYYDDTTSNYADDLAPPLFFFKGDSKINHHSILQSSLLRGIGFSGRDARNPEHNAFWRRPATKLRTSKPWIDLRVSLKIMHIMPQHMSTSSYCSSHWNIFANNWRTLKQVNKCEVSKNTPRCANRTYGALIISQEW